MPNHQFIDLDSDSDESVNLPANATHVPNVGWIRAEMTGGSIVGLKMKVVGQPKVLRRHQTILRNGRVHVFNPSRADKAAFATKVRILLNAARIPFGLTVLQSNHLRVDAFFLMQRPLSNFIGNNPENALREEASPFFANSASDVDNLLKFVLDATEGLVFENDRLVETVTATKCLAEGREGYTIVEYSKIGNNDMGAIVMNCEK